MRQNTDSQDHGIPADIMAYHLENAPLAVVEWDAHFRVAHWSAGAEAMFGWRAEEVLGLRPSEWAFVHPEDREAVGTVTNELLQGAVARNVSYNRNLDRDGDVHFCEWYNSIRLGDDGETVSILSMVHDLTPRLHAERVNQDLLAREQAFRNEAWKAREQLRQNESLLRIAGRLGRTGGWAIDLETGEHHWSDETFQLLGFEPGTLPPLEEALTLYPPEWRPVVDEALQKCSEDGTAFDLELEILDRQGQRFWARLVGEPETDSRGKVRRVLGAFQDISAAKRDEQEKTQLAERLGSTLEHMSDAFYLLDREWRFAYVNAEAENVLRASRDHIMGRNVWEAFPGTVDTVLYDAYRQAMQEGTPASLELYYPPLEEWFDVQAYPSEEGLAVYFRRVTAQRQMEERLRQSQRLESIGQLTGGVAHDFNNLLTVILGNSELLAEALADDPRLRPVAEVITGAAQRGSDLTQRLLAFARRQPLAPQAVEINRLLADMEPLLRRSLGDHVEIEFARAAGLWDAIIDPSQLENAVLNLCINARDAMPGGGQLTMETGNAHLSEEYAAAHADVSPGQYVMVAVSDAGHGIHPEHLTRVFEPFFTTKKSSGGSGLGLSMAFGFIKQSGGHIKIYSEPGQGTTVRMYLPRHTGTSAAYETPVTHDERISGSETILLVEDDAMVRGYAERELRELGYTVVTAVNGPDAMDILRSRPDIDLLFTDVVMPGGMSGKELAEQAQALYPRLPVLYTSGYTENAIVHHGRLDPGVLLLSKPYRRVELARKVRRALEKTPD